VYLAQEKLNHDAELDAADLRKNEKRSTDPRKWETSDHPSENYTPKQSPQPSTRPAVNLSAIVALFQSASDHQTRPKIRLTTRDGQRIVMSLAGSSSAHAGKIRVTDGAAFGSGGTFFGWIAGDGSTTVVNPGVLGMLKEFAVNPAEIAAYYGRKHGHCCFCARDLTDVRSTTVGYGPICADHYGLPWGVGSNESADSKAPEHAMA
jgi:hypothetical protein